MWWLYLDESGDLGFDFITKKPSHYFTIAILLIKGHENNLALIQATQTTIRRKLPKRSHSELKGARTSLDVKRYWFQKVEPIPFQVYALTLTKQHVYPDLQRRKNRLYNYLARQVIDRIPVEEAQTRVQLVVDRCKNQREVVDFNQYLFNQLQGRLDPRVPLDISHLTSHDNSGLQAIDLFAWGIFRRYEKADRTWLEIFREKVAYEEPFL